MHTNTDKITIQAPDGTLYEAANLSELSAALAEGQVEHNWPAWFGEADTAGTTIADLLASPAPILSSPHQTHPRHSTPPPRKTQPTPPPRKTPPALPAPRKLKRADPNNGGGCCLIMLFCIIGLVCMPFFPPIGFIFGGLIILVGMVLGLAVAPVKYKCPVCGNHVPGTSRLCPVCHTTLVK